MHINIGERVSLATKAEWLVCPCQPQYLDALFGHRHSVLERYAKGSEFLGDVSHADAELHTAMADVIKNGEFFSQPNRVIERHQRDVG